MIDQPKLLYSKAHALPHWAVLRAPLTKIRLAGLLLESGQVPGPRWMTGRVRGLITQLPLQAAAKLDENPDFTSSFLCLHNFDLTVSTIRTLH